MKSTPFISERTKRRKAEAELAAHNRKLATVSQKYQSKFFELVEIKGEYLEKTDQLLKYEKKYRKEWISYCDRCRLKNCLYQPLVKSFDEYRMEFEKIANEAQWDAVAKPFAEANGIEDYKKYYPQPVMKWKE